MPEIIESTGDIFECGCAAAGSAIDVTRTDIGASQQHPPVGTLIVCACGCGTSFQRLDNRGRARRFIDGHASRYFKYAQMRAGDIPREKKCNRCKLTLPASAFSMRTYHSKTTGESYLRIRSRCKLCEAAVSSARLKNEHGRAHKRRARAARRKTIQGWIHERLASWRRKTPGCDLTTDYLVALFKRQLGMCYYTGRTMNLAPLHADPDGVSLDRLTPSAGYMKGNVAFCAFSVNTMKGSLSEEEFYSRIELILRLRRQRRSTQL